MMSGLVPPTTNLRLAPRPVGASVFESDEDREKYFNEWNEKNSQRFEKSLKRLDDDGVGDVVFRPVNENKPPRVEYKMAFDAVELLKRRSAFGFSEVDQIRRYANWLSGTTQQPAETLLPVLASFGWIHLGDGPFANKLHTLQCQLGAAVIFKPYRKALTNAGVSFFEKVEKTDVKVPTIPDYYEPAAAHRWHQDLLARARAPIYVPRSQETFDEFSYEKRVLDLATYVFMGLGRGGRGEQVFANDDNASYNNRDGALVRRDYGNGDFGFAAIIDSKREGLPWPADGKRPVFEHNRAIDGRRPEHVIPGDRPYRYVYAYAFNDHSAAERSAAVEAARLAALLDIPDVVFMSRRERVWLHYKDDRMEMIDDNMNLIDVHNDAKESGRPLPPGSFQ